MRTEEKCSGHKPEEKDYETQNWNYRFGWYGNMASE